MREHSQFYINGEWVDPRGGAVHEVTNPATEEPCARIAMGMAEDVDRAVSAARDAFPAWSNTGVDVRIGLLTKICELYKSRMDELAAVVSEEMGAPLWLSKGAQVPSGLGHFAKMIEILGTFQFEELHGSTMIRKEPVGVCGLITPWNWPLNQIACKVAPALAAGCTMVLKPSEISPGNAVILTEILHEAGVPSGVFNLVMGDGPVVGEAMSAHPGIDMMSITGSGRAGSAVAIASAPTFKRVHQELGGKSANIILPDADLQKAVGGGVFSMMTNSGQSCNAPSRMLVSRDQLDTANAIASATAEMVKVAMPAEAERGAIGPISNAGQYRKVQDMIGTGLSEGAELLAGGEGRPEGFNRGYFARPTVFSHASNDMTIAREEIFGPVLTIIPYDSVDHAVEIANDTDYGLSGYVSGGDREQVRDVARRMRTGMVHLNGAGVDQSAPFGGYKQSGNGREWGVWGLEDFLEVKSVMGWEG